MSNIKLTYFDIDGGRAEPLRLAFFIGGIDFEDHRISFSEFRDMRNDLPFRALPVLQTEHGQHTQSGAMSRYFGKQAGLYPEDPWQAFLCDEILEVIEDATHFAVQTFFLKGEELEKARARLVEDRFIPYLKTLSERLSAAGGIYFAGEQLSLADLKVFIWVRTLRKGTMDHVPTDLVEQHAPSIAEHCDRIGSLEKIAAYYAARG
ncbi:MAG: glutathione S-transferase [Parasphingorhabdus sp.]|jgi:glutathione S-transferase